MIGALWLLVLFAPSTFGSGHFLSPSGSDGTTTLKEGDQINISWTGIDNYDIFSLGYYSTSNQTITWLISNSPDHPTQYTWTVDAVEQGFDLRSSHLFRFFACKDYNFSQPFQSDLFSIDDVSSPSSTTSSVSSTTTTTQSSTSTSSESTSTVSSATATATTTSVSSDSLVVSSTGLSSGAKIGIGVGVGAGVVAAAVLVFLATRHMRKSSRAHKSAVEIGGNPQEYQPPMYMDQSNQFGAYDQKQQQQLFGADKTYNSASPCIQEAPGSLVETQRAVELPATGPSMSENRSELPSPRE